MSSDDRRTGPCATVRASASARALVAAVGVGALLTACGGQPADTEPEGGSGGATTVAVRLQEWAVVPAQESAPAGGVKFALENKGEETHEFVVIQTDLGARELPTAKDGSVEEEGSGMQVVDEVEDIPSGNSATLTVSLDPGNYVLLCNIVEEKENESHYQMGMSTEFSVE